MAKCSWETCSNEAKLGKKYCPACAKVAHQKWLEMVTNGKAERENRDANFKVLWEEAVAAGNQQAKACQPVPMVVSQRVNPLDDSSPVTKAWFVPSGACGFAWIVIKPATSAFARWLAKQGIGHKSYYGGWEVSAGQVGGQSIEIKESWCRGVCKHLQAKGINCYMNSRLD